MLQPDDKRDGKQTFSGVILSMLSSVEDRAKGPAEPSLAAGLRGGATLLPLQGFLGSTRPKERTFCEAYCCPCSQKRLAKYVWYLRTSIPFYNIRKTFVF